MENYDEDLTENGWYITLRTKHDDLYTRATNERWMICIPRVGSWKENVEDGDLFSLKCFESHILKPVLIYSSDGNVVSTERENKYITYNGKELFIEGSKILCGNGFSNNYKKPSYDKRNEKLDLNIETCHSVKILFEETFFNQNEESYVVLCISDPLETDIILYKDDGSIDDDSSLPHSQSYGDYLWKHSTNQIKLRQQIDEKISQFILIEKRLSSNKRVAVLMEEAGSFGKNIKLLVEKVCHLLTMCLQIVLRDHKLKKLTENPSHKDRVKSSIEGYVLSGIHKVLSPKLNELLAIEDASLNKTTRNLLSITLSDLNIKEAFWSSIPRARRELSLINKYRTPEEKFACLQHAVASLSSKQEKTTKIWDTSPTTPVYDKSIGENSVALLDRTNKDEHVVMSSDDLLPILVYLTIKSDVANWWSNLYYLKEFHFAKSQQSKEDFYLATLEAAIQHISQGGLKRVKVASYKKQTSTEELEHFFTLINEGEVTEVERVLRQSKELRSLMEHDKCHPLCECSKCNKLTARRSRSGGQSRDVTLSSRDDKGRTAMHVAAMAGKHEVVEALIKQGADLNSSDYHGATPLHLAAQRGMQSAIFLLLHYGSNATAEDNNNNSPLHLACLGGHEGCVKALLFFDPSSSVVKINAANDVGDTPLHIASKWGYVRIVQSLVEYGADPHRTNKRKVTPLNICHNAIVSEVLRNTVVDATRVTHYIKAPSKSQVTMKKTLSKKHVISSHLLKPSPLDVEEDSYKQVEKLLRAVADNDLHMVSFVCGWNKTCQTKQDKCHPLCQCLRCQPNNGTCLHANSVDRDGLNPLIIASKLGYIKMVHLLLTHGSKVNVATKQHGHSPLHLGAQYGHKEIVAALLSRNASCDWRDRDGNTPVFMSVMNGHTHCTLLLIKAGASLNIRNNRGDSPLHGAVRWKHSATMCLLIQRGALAYYKNNRGETPIDIAANDKELHNSLMEALNKRDESEDGNTEEAKKDQDLTNHSPSKQLQRPTSIRLKEADELIADGLYKQFQNTPDTPPLFHSEPALFTNDIFDFDVESTNSFNTELTEERATDSNCNYGVTESTVMQQQIKEHKISVDCDSNAGTIQTDGFIVNDVMKTCNNVKEMKATMTSQARDILDNEFTPNNAGGPPTSSVGSISTCESNISVPQSAEETYFEITSLPSSSAALVQSERVNNEPDNDVREELVLEEPNNEPIVKVINQGLLKKSDSEYLSLNKKQ